MATVYWNPLAQATQMTVTLTVTAVVNGAILAATINGKTIQYTCTGADTTSTAAAAWFALLNNSSTAPAEFNELTWSNVTTVITATAKSAGTPFAGMTGGLVATGTGGATVTQTTTTANSSPSDVGNAKNWIRSGVSALPATGDDLVVANSTVPLLWNLTALAGIRLASYTRWQNFTGTIGLPDQNPNGYVEYRPRYLQLLGGGSSSSSSVGGSSSLPVLNALLGFGGGSGPTRERYDFLNAQVNCAAIASGTPADRYAITILGSNAANTVNVINTSVGVAMAPAETATLASATVGTGGGLALGPGVTFTGALTSTGGLVDLNCTPATLLAQGQSQVVQGSVAANLAMTYQSITLKGQSSLTWLSPSNITTLLMQTGSSFDKGQDVRAMQIGTLTLDVNDCIVNDPFNAITFVNPVVFNNALVTGPFRFSPGRTARFT